MKRGAWTEAEDGILRDHVKIHGEGKWNKIPKETGLKRCGKSCRLRWLKYLRPDIKRGNISDDEKDLIIRLHKLLGNRWSLIAGRLPGRTDNEIKNYWNTNIAKKMPRRSIPNTCQDQVIQLVEPSQSSRSETPSWSSCPMTDEFLMNTQPLVEPSQSSRSETPKSSLEHGKGDDALSTMNNDEFLSNISQELRFELQGGYCGSSSYDPLMFWEELETMFDSDVLLQMSTAPRS